MSVLSTVLGALGWRAVAGAAGVAVIVAPIAFQAGRWTEGQRTEALVDAARAQAMLKRHEAENDALDAANAARRRAMWDGVERGRMRDDGYRRD